MHPIIERVRKEGRSYLTETESKEILGQSGIRVNDTIKAVTEAEAAAASKKTGFPAVLKILSPDIIHKSDAGGVVTGLRSTEQVAEAYGRIISSCKKQFPKANIEGVTVQKEVPPGTELIIGMYKDAQFGPVVVFGLGGVWTEVLEDTSIRITPITREDAREMIEEIKGYKTLTGYRGQPAVDISKLEDMLLAVSDFVEKNAEVKELDINPVIASGESITAVDARIALEQP